MTRCWGHVPGVLSDPGEGSRLCGGWERFSLYSCGWVGGSVYWVGHPGIALGNLREKIKMIFTTLILHMDFKLFQS